MSKSGSSVSNLIKLFESKSQAETRASQVKPLDDKESEVAHIESAPLVKTVVCADGVFETGNRTAVENNTAVDVAEVIYASVAASTEMKDAVTEADATSQTIATTKDSQEQGEQLVSDPVVTHDSTASESTAVGDLQWFLQKIADPAVPDDHLVSIFFRYFNNSEDIFST